MVQLSVDALIGEVAKRHNLLLGKNDPILATVTLNELVVAAYVARIEESLKASLDQLSAAQVQHTETAKDIASAIVTRAADYGADQLYKATDDLLANLRAGLAADVAAAREAAKQAQQARQCALYVLVAAVVVLALMLGLVIGRSL